MESNYTLDDFKAEVIRRENTKEDFVAPTLQVSMLDDGETIRLNGSGEFLAQPNFHSQLANHHGIPKRYYDAMQAIPGLRAENVNAWLHHEPQDRMVRTLDGNARAYLSSKFRPLDNAFALKAMSPVFEDFKDLEVKSHSLTDLRLYMQIVFPKLEADIGVGDPVQQGITITNSEVGRGALDVSSLIWRLQCLNGMIGQSILSRRHVGSRIDFNTDVNIYQHDTIQAELESYKLRIRDVVRHALQESVFMETIEKLRSANEDEFSKRKARKTIENVTKKLELTEDDIDGIFGNLAKEGNYSRYGLANAITFQAHDAEPDKAFDYEKMGNKIIELSDTEWRQIVA